MASRNLKATAIGLAVTALAATTASIALPANAYTESPAGTYNVTTAELKTAFPTAASFTGIEFEVESEFTWYSVRCKKSLPNNKVMTKTFKRQSHLASIDTVTPTSTGFTIVVTGVEPRSNVRCPGGYQKDAEPVVLAKSSASHLIAEYDGMDVELVRQ